MNRVLTVPDGQEARIKQSISATAGTEYGVSFYYALASMPLVGTSCQISAVVDYYTGLKEIQLTTDLAYQQYTAYFIVRQANPTIEIRVSCDTAGNGDATRVWIDDTRLWNTADSCGASTPGGEISPMPTLALLNPPNPDPPLCPKQIFHAPSFDPIPGENPWVFAGLGSVGHDPSWARTGDYFGYDTLPNVV